jgi:hypothetical protein
MKRTLVCLALLLSFPLMAEAQGRRRRGDGGPKVGDAAPNFAAKRLKQKEIIEIKDLIKKSDKPIVLIFGSYT